MNNNANIYNFTPDELMKLKTSLYEAYFECRKRKRKSFSTMCFELHQEREVDELYEWLISGKYKIDLSCAFIVFEPVKREIFAADFRDRVLHHYLILRLNDIFERLFIYDSYSCRKGKGTHFAVSRVDHFMRSCSNNYKSDCYILKVDIQGFFMNIRKEILLEQLCKVVDTYYDSFDKCLLKDLLQQIVMHNPVPNCRIKGNKSDWQGLPESKSLFRTGGTVGLPIGNLTSQIFANLYLNGFDHFVKRELKVKYYGRYVDDCILMDASKERLIALIPQLAAYLQNELKLTIHPRKIYLQHFSKGVVFTGICIKPYRKYVGRRVQSKLNKACKNDYKTLCNKDEHNFTEHISHWLSSVNSYLGICKHYNTYNMRLKLSGYFKDKPIDFGQNNCVVKYEQ